MTRFVQVAVLALLLVGAVASYAAEAWRRAHVLTREEIGQIPERLTRVPLEVGTPPFHGTRAYLEDRIVKLSGADYYVAVEYQAPDGGSVRLHVGAAARTDAWFHEPTACLPAHGWRVTETTDRPLWTGLPGAPPGAQMRRMLLENAGQKMLVYYWLQFGDRILLSPFHRRWLRFLDLLAGHKDQPGMIVIFYAPYDDDLARAETRAETLARALWPRLFTILSPGD